MFRRNLRRILFDAAGYGLLVLAVLTGWLPGPGGLPLALAGLALLSVHNAWARRLRDYLLKNGGKLVKILFPANPFVQFLYDALVILLLVLVSVLVWRHEALWQISLAIFCFFVAVFIAAMNRDRLQSLRNRKHK